MIDPKDNKTQDIEELINQSDSNNKSQMVGYIRVSSIDQNTDRQLDGIRLDKVFIDKMTGSTKDRPELKRMIEYVRHGDTVVIHSLDRLARSLEDLISIIKQLNAKGVILKSCKDNLTFDSVQNSPMDRFFLHILGAVAELERALIKERQREGIAKAKARGVYKGRKSVLTDEVKHTIDELLDKKNSSLEEYKKLSFKQIAEKVGISEPTLYRYIKQKK